MAKISGGILLYRCRPSWLLAFLVHSGGPSAVTSIGGASTIPKGELAPGEEPLAAALREFEEETCLGGWGRGGRAAADRSGRRLARASLRDRCRGRRRPDADRKAIAL